MVSTTIGDQKIVPEGPYLLTMHVGNKDYGMLDTSETTLYFSSLSDIPNTVTLYIRAHFVKVPHIQA